MTMITEEYTEGFTGTDARVWDELLGYGFTEDEAVEIVKEQEYCLYSEIYEMSDVAREWVESIGSIKDALGARWDFYIDLDSVVRDFQYSGLISELEYEQEREDIAEGREYTERFPDHESLTAFAYELIEDGSVDSDYIESNDYIAWDMLGRDLAIEGTFLYITGLGILEVLR